MKLWTRISLCAAGIELLILPAGARTDPRCDPAQVIAHVEQAPLDANSFSDLATCLFRSGDLDHAAAAAREAVRLDPRAPRYRLLGYIEAVNGAQQQAAAAFAQAARLDPAMRVSIADFYVAQAWVEYQEALRRGPPDPAVAERLNTLAALGGVNPEVKTLLESRAARARTPATSVPPVVVLDHAYAVVIEKSTQTVRLYTAQDKQLVLVQTYPCTTGRALGPKRSRGDRRTPDGVYFVTDFLAGARLPGIYGALAMPLDYPNAWDRKQHRNGRGIWIHGSDRLAAPFTAHDTHGCVLMRNEDLIDLARLVAPGITPVLIAEHVNYQPAAQWQAQATAILARSPAQVLALASTGEYTAVVHRVGDILMYEYTPSDAAVPAVAEHAAPPTEAEWRQKLTTVLPAEPVTLVHVEVHDGEGLTSVVIDTSGPAHVETFHDDARGCLYVDLVGVRPSPVPLVVPGNGGWVKQIRVAAVDLDPPVTRLRIDVARPIVDHVDSEGTRITVSLHAAPVAARAAGGG